jgi:uncharacterized protein
VKPFHTPFKTIHYPGPGQVTLSGRLSDRYQGNRRYLWDILDKQKSWMLEPFQNRGQRTEWAGEYAGKWLDAASLVAAGTQDEQLGLEAGALAAALVATQEPDGYLGIEAPGKRGTGWDVWNMWNVLIGLLTHYDIQHENASLRAAARCGEWFTAHFGLVSESNGPFFSQAHDPACNGPIVDQFVRLHHFTEDRRFLDFASSVAAHYPPVHQEPNSDQAPLTHVYHLSAFLGGVVELAGATNDEAELQWVERVWEDLDGRHLYPTGSLGYREHLRESAPNDTPVDDGQPDKHHQETCATVEWLLFNARLHQATGGVRYVQRLERAIYNALLAAQSADGLQWMYYTPLRYEKRWFTGPTSCCYWSGPRGIARLPEWVYALDGEGIRVNLYESSEATFELDGHQVGVRQSSLYPATGKVTFEIQSGRTLTFALRLRIPFPGDEVQIHLNGQPVSARPGADGYFRIHRQWSNGDQLGMEFRVPVSVRKFLNDEYGVLVRGPEVLAVDQYDNASRDLDQIVLQKGMVLESIDPVNGRQRYLGDVQANGKLADVVFTPYADCGSENSRFRTAFPIDPGMRK